MNVRGLAAFLVVVVTVGSALPAAGAGAAQPAPAGSKGTVSQVSGQRLGPVTVRPFKPMTIRTVRLRERHGPVYFRSPLAEPTASDRDVDANVPLACGVTVADWMMLVFRALGFPVEMAVRPPWQSERPGR